jgi:cobalt-zinc-cadmium efflux system membrane fusion protein
MRISGFPRVLALLLLAAVLLGLPAAFLWKKLAAGHAEPAPEPESATGLQLVGTDTLGLPPEVVQTLGVQTAMSTAATQARPLPPLTGSLALDTNRLARVHPRFAGEVVEIGQTTDMHADRSTAGPTPLRPLRFGDEVGEGHLLAVIWSKDLGEKKSEFVDNLSQLRLDEEILERQRKAADVIPERTRLETERRVASDRIAVARAERTLRSWRLSEGEIKALRAEADRLYRRQSESGKVPDVPDPSQEERERKWAQVEVRAPFGGTILERNIAVGDIVDPGTDLFKIADLRQMSVWAHVYEEDLPALTALAAARLPKPLHWTIRLKADPQAAPLEGIIDKIGDIIDPTQHTALVTGMVRNPDGRLRAGQFITATIELEPAEDEVAIPTSALLDDGRESLVFVQDDPKRLDRAVVRKDYTYYTLRRVMVVRRSYDVVYVRSRLKPGEEQLTLEDRRAGLRPLRPLKPGERVVTSGVLEMSSALEDLRSKKKS